MVKRARYARPNPYGMEELVQPRSMHLALDHSRTQQDSFGGTRYQINKTGLGLNRAILCSSSGLLELS